jgi:hypothetical protein
MHEIIGRREAELAGFVQDLESLGDFGRSDLRLLRADYAGLIRSCRDAIAAYERGDLEAARRSQRQVKDSKIERRWRQRCGARGRQAESWPPEKWVFEMETQRLDARTEAQAPRCVAARRQAASAWASYAQAIVPAADEGRLVELEDQAYAADAEVRAASAIWTLYVEVYFRAASPKVQSPQLSEKLQSLEQWRESIQAICRDRAEIERRQRQWDRTRERLNREIAEAYQQAWNDAERRTSRRTR